MAAKMFLNGRKFALDKFICGCVSIGFAGKERLYSTIAKIFRHPPAHSPTYNGLAPGKSFQYPFMVVGLFSVLVMLPFFVGFATEQSRKSRLQSQS
ncbi:MAG: hypothetical protein M1379_08520 [Firmicutes bacterium]|nr:hypothetical protein [Bacillota bacterium]